MTASFSTRRSIERDLKALGLGEGDGVFVHASMSAIGVVIGGPRTIIEALFSIVGDGGLIAMPGFSTDAYFPDAIDRTQCSPAEIAEIEASVPGFDMARSPAAGMGVIAEAFRTWPETIRSDHPAISVCLNGKEAEDYASRHSLTWATGPDTPFGRFRQRPNMKILLIGVGWNRCTALHMAETIAESKRTKTRWVKTSSPSGDWMETPDVADDLDRLFPSVGKAFEETGAVIRGLLGKAETRVCDYGSLIAFAAPWIGEANLASGDRH
ncbi:MAG: aminoglycoside N(3)-acetyltransferase [Geminicoccaceae bacterium]